MDFLDVAKRQFMMDYQLKTFPKDKIKFIESKVFPLNSMNYLKGTPFLNFIYFGDNLFICANQKIKDFVTLYIQKCGTELYRVFDAPNCMALNNELEKYGYTIAHLAQYFLPTTQFTEVDYRGYTIQLFCKNEIEELYSKCDFPLALCGTTKGRRRDELALACIIDGGVVGVAACTNDSDTMWQIGVEINEKYQKKGIGTILVQELKNEILKLGKVPFYCCAWSNLASKRLARKAGFVDAWVELSAKRIDEDWISNIRNI